MKRSDFSEMPCAIARAFDVIGEWWTPLIIRNLFLGNRRFEALRKNLGISKKILADRLQSLVDAGVVKKRLYEHSPPRYEYVLTEMGQELGPILLAIATWGEKWLWGGQPPLVLTHRTCGHVFQARVVCSHCGEPVEFNQIKAKPGPGMSSEQAVSWVEWRKELAELVNKN